MPRTETISLYAILHTFIVEANIERAQNELDNLIEIAIITNDYSFSTGLLGAGWLIAYLHQQEIITGDIDELLYDFDDNLYKLAIKIIVAPAPDLTDLIEIINYYQQRLQNKSTSYNFYRRFSLFETMKLLTEKLIKIADNELLTTSQLIQIILKLSYLSKTCINEKEIEEIYYSKTEILITYFNKLSRLTYSDIDNIKLLQLASIQFENLYWVKAFDLILLKNNLNDTLHLNSIETSINSFLRKNKNENFSLSHCCFKNREKILFQLISNIKRIKIKQN